MYEFIYLYGVFYKFSVILQVSSFMFMWVNAEILLEDFFKKNLHFSTSIKFYLEEPT